MKKILIVGCLLSVLGVQAVVTDNSRLVGASMKDFVTQFVAENEQLQFVKYYEEFSKIFEKENAKKQEAARVALFEKAMDYLQQNDSNTHSFVADRIKQLRTVKGDSKKELQNIERFLVRCGVYADFVALKGISVELKQLHAFADDSFTDFLKRIVAQNDHASFTRYYEDLSERLTKCDEQKKIVTYRYLFDKALSDLETKHADWHAVLTAYGSPEGTTTFVGSKARLFLRRYGAYQEYLDVTGQAGNGLFASIGSVCSNIGKTISGWFGSNAA